MPAATPRAGGAWIEHRSGIPQPASQAQRCGRLRAQQSKCQVKPSAKRGRLFQFFAQFRQLPWPGPVDSLDHPTLAHVPASRKCSAERDNSPGLAALETSHRPAGKGIASRPFRRSATASRWQQITIGGAAAKPSLSWHGHPAQHWHHEYASGVGHLRTIHAVVCLDGHFYGLAPPACVSRRFASSAG